MAASGWVLQGHHMAAAGLRGMTGILPPAARPLIAASQPDSVSLEVGRTAAGQGGFVEIVNPNPFAVDVSGW